MVYIIEPEYHHSYQNKRRCLYQSELLRSRSAFLWSFSGFINFLKESIDVGIGWYGTY